MLLHRGLFLATLISAVSVVFADILVQPVTYSDQPNNVQPDSDYICLVPMEESYAQPDQYVAIAEPQQLQAEPQQLQTEPQQFQTEPQQFRIAFQQLQTEPQQLQIEPQQLQEHPDNSNLQTVEFIQLAEPSYWSSHVSRSHGSYTKIGGRGYTRPTVIIKYPKSAHRRYRRSTETTSNESSEPASTTYANDVAEESALVGDKHVTSHQLTNDDAAIGKEQLDQEALYQDSQNAQSDSNKKKRCAIGRSSQYVETYTYPSANHPLLRSRRQYTEYYIPNLNLEKRHVITTRSPDNIEAYEHPTGNPLLRSYTNVILRRAQPSSNLQRSYNPLQEYSSDTMRWRRSLKKRQADLSSLTSLTSDESVSKMPYTIMTLGDWMQRAIGARLSDLTSNPLQSSNPSNPLQSSNPSNPLQSSNPSNPLLRKHIRSQYSWPPKDSGPVQKVDHFVDDERYW
ncbi:uncharacterized protein [Linepithema humile]|uniref:uncharacterized protein isoform X2 n=1 Tax=Linepithema humile TaxID=83485 RepID=UPI00062313BA|nr:PREDICTED: uncharacterized protein LOC105675449 isoform X2 [Linepithema humile]